MNERKISNEHKLIFFCARLEINNFLRENIGKLFSSHLDWNKIIEISNRHQILPFLYYNLSRLNFQNLIPQDIFEIMRNCYYGNFKKNLIVEKELSSIAELTNRQGIGLIPFRGLSLMQTLYRNPGLRIMVDIDILTKEEDFERIRYIFTQFNYQENSEEDIIVFTKTVPPNLNLVIELHCALAPARPYKINLPYLWERTRQLSLNNQKLPCLSEEDTFLSLALHLRRHLRRLTLKFIVDISELLSTSGEKLDWKYIKKSAQNNHIMTTVYLALYAAKELLDMPVPAKILNEFRPNIIKIALMRFTINKSNFFALKKWNGAFLRFLLFDSCIDLLLYLWRVSFLERAAAKQRFTKIKENPIKKIPENINVRIKR